MSDEVKTDETEEQGDGLNDRRRAFCREYVIDWNASQAAIRAGYSQDTARSIASQLLTNINVKAEIKRLIDEFDETHRTESIARNVQLWEMMLTNNDLRPDYRLRASELLGKHAGMFIEKMELSGEVKTGSGIPQSPEELDKWYEAIKNKQ
jgi:phage terminase small subunit